MLKAAKSCYCERMVQRHASPAINGERLRELRQEAGHSVSDLARLIGISPQYLTQIERGHRPTVSPKMFLRILAAIGVTDRNELLRSFEQSAA